MKYHSLDLTLHQFAEALRSGKTINLDKDGNWWFEGAVKKFLNQLLGKKNLHIYSIIKAYLICLDRLEQIPVYFRTNGTLSNFQEIDFLGYLNVGQVLDSLGKQHLVSPKLLSILQRRLIGLKYRLQEIADEKRHLPLKGKENFDKVIKIAKNWKMNETVSNDQVLTFEEMTSLQEATRYPDFLEKLLEDIDLQKSFFVWVLQNKLNPSIFIEFPSLSDRIKESVLQARLGRFGGKALKLKYRKSTAGNFMEKIVTLPFEGREESILDETHKVTFRGNFSLSVGAIFEVFKNKNLRVGDFELFNEGIINWNVHKLGWWDADHHHYRLLDVLENEWWKKLPVFEVLNLKQASKRYDILLDGANWVVAASATRESPTLDFENTHAFFEIALPLNKNHYQIFHFGKFGIYFPSSFYESLKVFCHMMDATVAYPDENVFYNHRQHSLHPFVMNPMQGKQIMDLIKNDILKTREGNFVYQIESENCAKWLHEKLVHVLGEPFVPNLFKMSLLKTEPTGFSKKIFDFVKKWPLAIQAKLLTRMHFIFGAWRGKWVLENEVRVWKSLAHHEFWETAEVYLPALLIEQKAKGKLSFITEPVLQEAETIGYCYSPPKQLPRLIRTLNGSNVSNSKPRLGDYAY